MKDESHGRRLAEEAESFIEKERWADAVRCLEQMLQLRLIPQIERKRIRALWTVTKNKAESKTQPPPD